MRVEQIALHVASTYGGAQFYISCAQVNVVNGGNGTPGPLVSIPGVYTGVRVFLPSSSLSSVEWDGADGRCSTSPVSSSTSTTSPRTSLATRLVSIVDLLSREQVTDLLCDTAGPAIWHG